MSLTKPVDQLTISDKAYLLAISSLRPVQFLIALTGFVAAVGMTIAVTLNLGTPLDKLIIMINHVPVLLAFYGYSAISLWCSLSMTRSNHVTRLKYTASCLGVILWSLCFASALQVVDGEIAIADGVSLVFFVPMFADVWILAQLMSGVRNVSRRT